LYIKGVWEAQTMATDMIGILAAGCRTMVTFYFFTNGHGLSESGRLTASPGKVCTTL